MRRNARVSRCEFYFPTRSVFDIDQTDKTDPGSARADRRARVRLAPLRRRREQGITEAVAAWLETQGWTFSRQPFLGETNGYTMTDGSAARPRNATALPAPGRQDSHSRGRT